MMLEEKIGILQNKARQLLICKEGSLKSSEDVPNQTKNSFENVKKMRFSRAKKVLI